MGRLIGRGCNGDIIELIDPAFIGEGLPLPGFLQDLQSLPEPLTAVVIGYAVHIIGAGEPAAPNAQLQPALADMVNSGYLFGDAQGVVKGQHVNGGADAHAFGAGSDGAGNSYG
jgi:hypothetical protein